MGTMIQFASNGGTTPGYLAEPAQGDGPGVIVIQEWWGLNDHVKAVADRYAAQGFVALAPDLYHGKVTKSPDEAGKLLMALNIAQGPIVATFHTSTTKSLTLSVFEPILRPMHEKIVGRIAVSDLARRWLSEFEGAGLDGVVAKPGGGSQSLRYHRADAHARSASRV